MINKHIYYFFLLAFLEGATVMATELLGAKMLAPFFGSSLYVWSSVMAVTLFGLAAGYFTGGWISEKDKPEIRLYRVLSIAALFTVLMPFTSKMALFFFGMKSLLPAVISSSLLILFPPVFLMGMVSPMIVRNCSDQGWASGRAAGTVYAVSTLGGILATFLFGFYIIPEFGLTIPCIVCGIFLGIFPAFSLVRKKLYSKSYFFLLILFFAFFQIKASYEKNNFSNGIKVLYTSEGLLGQVEVLDYPSEYYYADTSRKGEYSRWLFVNRISQTMNDPYANRSKGEEQYFTYVYLIEEMLKELHPNQKNILLLGLGGGSVATHLTYLGYQVEACELDQRIAEVAKKYFNLPASVQVTIDDARHHIKTLTKKYDAIIFDTFKGEETPNHILTQESLIEIKKILNDDGIILINSFGYWKGEKGRGMRCIYKTLADANLNPRIWPTHHNEDQRNLVFIASNNIIPKRKEFIYPTEEEMQDAVILSDEKPVFEVYNAKAGLQWRRLAIQTYYRDINQRNVGLFE